jgi:hypothetical protein
MMTQYEVPGYITGKLPQLKTEMARHHSTADIYASLQALTDYTKRMAILHDFQIVKKCMTLVEKIYKEGTACVKSAVENVFIFSLSSIMTACNIVEWRILQSYMPACLYTLYIHQVLKGSC